MKFQLSQKKAFYFFSFFFLFFSFFRQNQIYAKILFQNIPRPLEFQIKEDFALRGKKSLEGYQVDLVIKKIMETGYYERVYAFLNKNNDLIFVAHSLKKVKLLHVSGNRAFSKKVIQNVLNLYVGNSYRSQKILEAVKKLKEFYVERGYHRAQIKLNKKNKGNFVYLNFEISENFPSVVDQIIINTENRKLQKNLSSKLIAFKGQKFSRQVFKSIEDQCIRFLKKGFFFSSRISKGRIIYSEDKMKVKIIYEIRDPYQYRLKIKGNVRLSDEKLLFVSQFRETQMLDLNFISKMSNRIRDYYLEYGYTHVKIHQRVREKKSDFDREIVFSIKEGPRVRIKKIDVFGDVSKPSSYYSNLIIKRSTKLVRRGIYSKKGLEIGFAQMLSYLRNEGYLNARIYSTEVKYRKSNKIAYVLVFLSEGHQVKVQSIQFIGNQFFSKKDLLRVIQLKKDAPLRQNQLIRSIKSIKEFYRNQGFLEIKILNEKELMSYKERDSLLKVSFQIKEGPRVILSSIVVKGNRLTKKRVILKTLKVQRGDVLTSKTLDKAMSRLNRMGLFSKVYLQTLEKNTNISKRTLIVDVVERKPGLMGLGLGLNNERDVTIRGFTRISYSNLFGMARSVSSRLEGFWNIKEIRYFENSFDLGYMEPFFLGTLIRGRINFNRSERVFDFLTQYDAFLMKRSHQVEVFLEQSLNSHITAKWILYNLSANSDFLFPKRIGVDRLSVDQKLAYVGLQLDFNYLNNIFSPTRGFSTRFLFRYTAPYFGSSSGIEFIKVEGRHSFYLPLWSRRFVFAQSLRGGYIENVDEREKSGIPASQIFVLGGGSSLRGFGGRERVPSEKDLPFESINTLIITGRNLYYLGKSEIRFPLYKSFGGVLFYDAGEVIVFQRNQGRKKFKRAFRQSIGLGGRIQTPVAPLAFDFACKLKPLESESKCRFHLSIGVL